MINADGAGKQMKCEKKLVISFLFASEIESFICFQRFVACDASGRGQVLSSFSNRPSKCGGEKSIFSLFWVRSKSVAFRKVYDSPPQNVAGKQALIVTLKAKQGLQIVLAFKEEEEKKQLMSDIAKHNPAITFGAPGFVPLAERPHLGPEEKKESGSMKLQRQSSDRSALSHSAQT